jgi:hypothetical protein
VALDQDPTQRRRPAPRRASTRRSPGWPLARRRSLDKTVGDRAKQ